MLLLLRFVLLRFVLILLSQNRGQEFVCCSYYFDHPAQIMAEECYCEIFIETFDDEDLSPSKWLIAHRQWGGMNGGVVKGACITVPCFVCSL